MIGLLCLLVVGAFAAPYDEYSARSLSLPVSYGQQRQLVEVAAPIRIVEERIPTVVHVQSETPAINSYNHFIDPQAGEFSLQFETSNGISTKESGFLKSIPVGHRVLSGDDSYGYGGETRIVAVDGIAQARSGETTWCSPEGILFKLTYTADENGYRPEITEGSCTYAQYDTYASPVPVETRTVLNSGY